MPRKVLTENFGRSKIDGVLAWRKRALMIEIFADFMMFCLLVSKRLRKAKNILVEYSPLVPLKARKAVVRKLLFQSI